MVDIEFVLKNVPIPGFLKAKFVKRPQILIDDPLFHEFLEGIWALIQRGQIIRGESGQNREQAPASPEPLVEEVLHVLGIVFHEDGENGVSNLRMPGLIGLNASDHPLKHVVAGFAGQRRQPDKLQIGEPGFQDEIRADGELNRVLSQRQFIKEVAGSDREPIIGVVELVRPIELGVQAH